MVMQDESSALGEGEGDDGAPREGSEGGGDDVEAGGIEDAGSSELEPPRKLSRRDRKRRKILEVAKAEYGVAFVKKIEGIRDVRERIVYVAETVFARKGFAGARTQEIGDLAGVNKAMIHYYFDRKDKLYHAVLDKLLFDLIKLTQESILDDAPPAKQVDAFYRGFFDYLVTHRNFSRLAAMERGASDRYLARMVDTFFKPLFDRGVAFIERGVAEGAFGKKVDAKHFLISVYGMTNAYFADSELVEALFGEDPLAERALKQRREALLDMVFAGLGCDRPKA